MTAARRPGAGDPFWFMTRAPLIRESALWVFRFKDVGAERQWEAGRSPQGLRPAPARRIARDRTLARAARVGHHPHMRRSRQLKPLSSEHHHALLVAFQLKQALAGHAESAGAPRDLAGLVGLVRRFDAQVLRTHTRTEEDVLGAYLTPEDIHRLRAEHGELARLVEAVDDAERRRAANRAGGLRGPAGAPRPLGGARAVPLRRRARGREHAGRHRRRAGAQAGPGPERDAQPGNAAAVVADSGCWWLDRLTTAPRSPPGRTARGQAGR